MKFFNSISIISFFLCLTVTSYAKDSNNYYRDEVSGLMQAAKEMTASINTSMPTAQSELDAIRKKVLIKMDDSYALKTSISEILAEISRIGNRSDARNAYLAKITELQTKQTKLAEENRAIDLGMQEAREKAERLMDTATTQLVTGIIAANLQIATSTARYLEQDNRTELANMLILQASGTPIDILEMTKLNGLTLKFRVGKTINCLSTRLQCGGKSFSVSR